MFCLYFIFHKCLQIRKPRPLFSKDSITTNITTVDTVTSVLSPHLIFQIPFYFSMNVRKCVTINLIQPPISQIIFYFVHHAIEGDGTFISFTLLPNFISCVMRISYSLKFIDQDDMQTIFLVHFSSKRKKGERISVQVEQIY